MGVEVNVNPEPVQPASTRIKNLVKWLLYNGPPDELLLRYSIQSDKLETERPALLNMTWKEHIPNITEYRNTLNYFCLAWGIIAGSMIPRPGQKLEDNPYFVDSPFIPDREKGHRLFSTSIMQKNISYTYQYDEYSGKVEIISQEYRGHRIHKIRVTLRENGPVNISETDFLQIPDLFGMQGDKIPLHFEKKTFRLPHNSVFPQTSIDETTLPSLQRIDSMLSAFRCKTTLSQQGNNRRLSPNINSVA